MYIFYPYMYFPYSLKLKKNKKIKTKPWYQNNFIQCSYYVLSGSIVDSTEISLRHDDMLNLPNFFLFDQMKTVNDSYKVIFK